MIWVFTDLQAAQTVKRLPVMRKMWIWSLCGEDPLKKEMATHSNIFAWKTPWTEEPFGLQTVGSQRVDTTEHTHTHTHRLLSGSGWWNTGASADISLRFPSDVHPEVGLLDHTVVLVFSFWGPSIRFSIVATQDEMKEHARNCPAQDLAHSRAS